MLFRSRRSTRRSSVSASSSPSTPTKSPMKTSMHFERQAFLMTRYSKASSWRASSTPSTASRIPSGSTSSCNSANSEMQAPPAGGCGGVPHVSPDGDSRRHEERRDSIVSGLGLQQQLDQKVGAIKQAVCALSEEQAAEPPADARRSAK